MDCPGDPARIILGSNATEAALAFLRVPWGLNDPFLVRYGRFMPEASPRGFRHILPQRTRQCSPDYRTSGQHRGAGYLEIVFSVIIGIPVGIISEIKQYSVLDNITMFITPVFF